MSLFQQYCERKEAEVAVAAKAQQTKATPAKCSICGDAFGQGGGREYMDKGICRICARGQYDESHLER